MQADQTVISLRPGGGVGTRGSRFALGLSSTSSSDSLLPLRPHGGSKAGELRFEGQECVRYLRDQLLQLREVANIPEDILKIKLVIEAEFGSEDQSRGHGDSNQFQTQSRYSEPDNRDWRGRSAQLPALGEERSWEALRDNKEFSGRFESRPLEADIRKDQLNSQVVRV